MLLKKKRRWLGLVLLLCALMFALPFTAERHYFVAAGEELKLPKLFTAFVEHEVRGEEENSFDRDGGLRFSSAGEYSLDSRLFGILPLQDVSVSVYEEREVVPGGQSVGLIMKTRGVVVVGYSAVTDEKGKTVYPAKDGGVALGDCLLSVDGTEVEKR